MLNQHVFKNVYSFIRCFREVYVLLFYEISTTNSVNKRSNVI